MRGDHEEAYSLLRQAAMGLPSIEEEESERMMVKGSGLERPATDVPGLQATAISA